MMKRLSTIPKNTTLILLGLNLYINRVHAWVDHYDEGEDDAKVVKIFLPLIACAILTCIAGCYFKKHCEGESSDDVEGGDKDTLPDTKSVRSFKAPPIDPTLSDFDKKMMLRRQSRMSKGKSVEDHPDNCSIKDNQVIGGHIISTNKTWHGHDNKYRLSDDRDQDCRRGSHESDSHNPSHIPNRDHQSRISGHHSPQRYPTSPINPHKKTTSRNTEITGFDTDSPNSISPSFPQANTLSMDNPEPMPQARPRQHKSLRGQVSNISNLSNISRSNSDHPSKRGSRHTSQRNKENVEINGHGAGLMDFNQWSYLLEKDPSEMTDEELIKFQQMSRARMNAGFQPPTITSLPNRPGQRSFREEEHHFS